MQLEDKGLVLPPGETLLLTHDGFHYAEAGVHSSLLLPRRLDLDVGRRGGEPQRQRRQQRTGLRLLRDSGGQLPTGARRRRGGGAAAERRQRQGETPDAECQHGLHGAADAYPHGAGGQEALQNRDAASGVQLHLTPGQCAGGRGREGGRPAVSDRCVQGAEGEGRGQTAADHLHVLPEQPAERGKTSSKYTLTCAQAPFVKTQF